MSTTEKTNENVEQTLDTKRDKVMTFTYDMSLEPKYEKPTYPGTGDGLSGKSGEYDVGLDSPLPYPCPAARTFTRLAYLRSMSR